MHITNQLLFLVIYLKEDEDFRFCKEFSLDDENEFFYFLIWFLDFFSIKLSFAFVIFFSYFLSDPKLTPKNSLIETLTDELSKKALRKLLK